MHAQFHILYDPRKTHLLWRISFFVSMQLYSHIIPAIHNSILEVSNGNLAPYTTTPPHPTMLHHSKRVNRHQPHQRSRLQRPLRSATDPLASPPVKSILDNLQQVCTEQKILPLAKATKQDHLRFARLALVLDPTGRSSTERSSTDLERR